jgi:hypothetical protein
LFIVLSAAAVTALIAFKEPKVIPVLPEAAPDSGLSRKNRPAASGPAASSFSPPPNQFH